MIEAKQRATLLDVQNQDSFFYPPAPARARPRPPGSARARPRSPPFCLFIFMCLSVYLQKHIKQIRNLEICKMLHKINDKHKTHCSLDGCARR
jgi:hypothetical protein